MRHTGLDQLIVLPIGYRVVTRSRTCGPPNARCRILRATALDQQVMYRGVVLYETESSQ